MKEFIRKQEFNKINKLNILLDNYYDQKLLKSNLVVNGGRTYQQCSLSVMDTIEDPYIRFDVSGVSNYYEQYKSAEEKYLFTGNDGKENLMKMSDEIIRSGKGKRYDCILGLSGGVDSTYLCWLAKELGLRPLVVHFDNGWNSELAVSNIERTISKLNFDLFTYVVDWKEFCELQLSYLKSSVVDIEALTDHAFMAVLYEQARKWKIKYVLAGMNIVTEQVLPSYWIFNKGDVVNIKDIQSKFGNIPVRNLKSYPFLNYKTKWYCDNVLKLKVFTPLNFIEYRYDEVKDLITRELDWRDYGGKHFESVWTRFYQGYILPRKFNIDKRKAHFSNLIFSGQLNKNEAISLLSKPIYDLNFLKQDMSFVLKKFGLKDFEFEELMRRPRVEHSEFKTLKSYKARFPIIRYFSRLKGFFDYK